MDLPKRLFRDPEVKRLQRDLLEVDVGVEYGTTAGTACEGNDSRLSDARTPTAHATSHQSGGSDAIKLDDLASPDDNTDLNASTSAHGLLKKLSNSASEFMNGQGNWASAGDAAALPSERWAKPVSAHADDEEFVSTVNNFTLYDATGAVVSGEPVDSTIDPYSDDTTNHHASFDTYRADWLTFKTRRVASNFFFEKGVTLATNVMIYTRIGGKWRVSPSNNDVNVGLTLMADSGGTPDPNNYIGWAWIPSAASGFRLQAYKLVAGAVTTVFVAAPQGGGRPDILGIHKLGTTYHFWAFDGGGGSWYMGSTTHASTMVYVGFYFRNEGNTPGNGLAQVDFLRFNESATFLP